ncbi:uncharacterized protein LOC123500547 [Portunus trituberculatus]|uniref:uncharacterized protein LOC123500547 n=1 Tax=Portunus trituberculatus TaxID=210409 RepID=UPI001E1CE29D|nr:uncharacterized protein LOC123500547 [Portunus trituberculatus]
MAFFLLLWGTLGTALATPTHLKPGALVAPLGTVTLVEDALFVRYSYSTLHSVPGVLRGVASSLAEMVRRVEVELAEQTDTPSYPHSTSILNLLKTRLTFLSNKLATATYDFSKHPMHARNKRGLINAFGKISQTLFGTAMDEDVQDLRERYNHLVNIATTNRRVINMHSKHIASLESHLKDLLGHTNHLRSVLNDAIVRIAELTDFVLVDQSLEVLESALDAMLSYNSVLIQNLVNASRGIVTAALFPVADLIKTLDIGQTIFKLQPLFNRDIVEHYYPILETVLTLEAVVIYVPFKSMDTFHAYEIIPFPFSINTSVLILDLPPTLVLIAKDFSVYTTTSRDSLSSCMSSYLHRYHCDATLLFFAPL